MTGVFNRLIMRIFPPVPEEIRDDVAILRANRLRRPAQGMRLSGLIRGLLSAT